MFAESWEVIQQTREQTPGTPNQEQNQKRVRAPAAKTQVQVQSALSGRECASSGLRPSGSSSGHGQCQAPGPPGLAQQLREGWSQVRSRTPLQLSHLPVGCLLHEQGPGASSGQGLRGRQTPGGCRYLNDNGYDMRHTQCPREITRSHQLHCHFCSAASLGEGRAFHFMTKSKMQNVR